LKVDCQYILQGVQAGHTVSLKTEVWTVADNGLPIAVASSLTPDTIITADGVNTVQLTSQTLATLPTSVFGTANLLIIKVTRILSDNYDGVFHLSRLLAYQPTSIGNGSSYREVLGSTASPNYSLSTASSTIPTWETLSEDGEIVGGGYYIVDADTDVTLTIISTQDLVAGTEIRIIVLNTDNVVTINDAAVGELTARNSTLFYTGESNGWIVL
jgi:hypothetical protein